MTVRIIHSALWLRKLIQDCQNVNTMSVYICLLISWSRFGSHFKGLSTLTVLCYLNYKVPLPWVSGSVHLSITVISQQSANSSSLSNDEWVFYLPGSQAYLSTFLLLAFKWSLIYNSPLVYQSGLFYKMTIYKAIWMLAGLGQQFISSVPLL